MVGMVNVRAVSPDKSYPGARKAILIVSALSGRESSIVRKVKEPEAVDPPAGMTIAKSFTPVKSDPSLAFPFTDRDTRAGIREVREPAG